MFNLDIRKKNTPKNWNRIIKLVDNKTINNIKSMEILGLKKQHNINY